MHICIYVLTCDIIQEIYILSAQFICVFRTTLRTNSDYLSKDHEQIFLYTRGFLRERNPLLINKRVLTVFDEIHVCNYEYLIMTKP